MDKTRIANLWNGKDGFVFLGFEIRKVKMKRYNGTVYYATDMWICKKKIESHKGESERNLEECYAIFKVGRHDKES